MLEAFVTDLRIALRWFRKSPGFTVVAVVSLAIGIGFNTAIYTVADALLFRPLPVVAPDQLVDVFTSGSDATSRFGTSSYPDYLDLRAQNAVFSDIVGYSPMFAAVSGGVGSQLRMGEIVTGNYFGVLGVGAARGRTIAPPDDSAGAPPVVMVSYRYWTHDLDRATDAVGRTLRIRGQAFTVIGVAPEHFTGMVPMLSPDLWIPVAASLDVEPVGLHDVVPSPSGTSRLGRRGDRWLFMRGRLRRGRTVAEARANLGVVMARLRANYPVTNKGRVISALPTTDVHVHPDADARIRPALFGLMLVVGLVLLIACANVAGMLLVRASARRKEIGVRLALGASGRRLVRQLLTESLVLSGVGGIVGALFAWWAVAALAAVRLPIPLPLVFDLRLDYRILLFTFGVTAAAGVIAGAVPIFQTLKPTVAADLRGSMGTERIGRRWTLRDALVVGEMAVTAVLLVLASLLTRGVIAAQRTSLGFAADRLAVVSVDPRMLRYSDERSAQFFRDALARVDAIPGVVSAAISTRPPFSVNYSRWQLWVPGHQRPGDAGDTVEVTTVSPTYFETLGVPIVEGRNFAESDRPDAPRVAIVNETFARRYFPGRSAIGRTFRATTADGPVYSIVGVAADHKVTAVDEGPTPFVHVARSQRPNTYAAIIARTRGDAPALLRDMRQAVLSLDPNVVFVESETMEGEVGATLFPVRAAAWLTGSVGLMAMLLAAVGLYGVIAYSAACRTRELGIRIALGARRGTIVRLVMGQGLAMAAAGLGIGFLLAAGSVGVLAGILYGVSRADPVAWAFAAVVVLGVSGLANLVPAWRAARVDPTEALKLER
ncbi:MAG TPA: ABC transporter permease [Vicinamibacterales bacterium]|nr:ABC transporter permease [Vicinamibacterales bacterium]